MNKNQIIISGRYSSGLGAASKTIQHQARALKELGDDFSAHALNPNQENFRGTVNMQLPPGMKYLVKRFSLFFSDLEWDKDRRYIKKGKENIALVKISSIQVGDRVFSDLPGSYLYFGLKGGHYRRGTLLEVLTPVDLPLTPACYLAVSVDADLIETGQSRGFLAKRKLIMKLRKIFGREDGNWFKFKKPDNNFRHTQ